MYQYAVIAIIGKSFSLFICACLLKQLDILYQHFMNLCIYEKGWGWGRERPEIDITRAGSLKHSEATLVICYTGCNLKKK